MSTRCAWRLRTSKCAPARRDGRDEPPRQLIVRSDQERALKRIACGGGVAALKVTLRPIGVALGESPFRHMLLAGPCGFEGGNGRCELLAATRLGGGGSTWMLAIKPAVEQQRARIVRFERARMPELRMAARASKRRAQRFEFRQHRKTRPLQRERLGPVRARL